MIVFLLVMIIIRQAKRCCFLKRTHVLNLKLPNMHAWQLNLLPKRCRTEKERELLLTNQLRVCLLGGEIGWVENFGEKMGRKIFWNVFGLVGRKENKWWGPGVFSQDPPKSFISKMERKLREKSSWNELPNIPLEFTSKFTPCWLLFFLIYFFLLIFSFCY